MDKNHPKKRRRPVPKFRCIECSAVLEEVEPGQSRTEYCQHCRSEVEERIRIAKARPYELQRMVCVNKLSNKRDPAYEARPYKITNHRGKRIG